MKKLFSFTYCVVNIFTVYLFNKKIENMTTQKIQHRGTEINKIQFSEIESYLEDKGLNVDNAFNILADENEFVYVSNGFVKGLLKDVNEEGEWHHFFIKSNGFEAGIFTFN